MFRFLFRAMLEGASSYYGESIGLSPIALATPKLHERFIEKNTDYWETECSINPHQIACLNYES